MKPSGTFVRQSCFISRDCGKTAIVFPLQRPMSPNSKSASPLSRSSGFCRQAVGVDRHTEDESRDFVIVLDSRGDAVGLQVGVVRLPGPVRENRVDVTRIAL